ncbi:MAG TPA: hypothetical protein VJ085_03870 [Candidatus Acidoferrales bacterium]|nr:hypothetical protein [Candidatus Acidoferrales bacterium]
MRTRVSFLVLALLLGLPARGQEFWQKKDYRSWSEEECRRLLKDSPWAKRRTPMVKALREDRWGRVLVQSTDAQARTFLYYQVQLRSVLPIRQALVRLKQIASGDEAILLQQQNSTGAEAALAASFTDTVVVRVAYRSNFLDWDRELALYWQRQTTDTLKNSVFLIGGKHAKVPLLRYWVGEGDVREFEFVFPRMYQGHPVVSPQDKTLQLHFPHPELSWRGPGSVVIEFKVREMTVGGEVAY